MSKPDKNPWPDIAKQATVDGMQPRIARRRLAVILDPEQHPEQNESTQGLRRMQQEVTLADEKLRQLDEEIEKAEEKSKKVIVSPEP